MSAVMVAACARPSGESYATLSHQYAPIGVAVPARILLGVLGDVLGWILRVTDQDFLRREDDSVVCLKPSISKVPSLPRKVSRLIEARLQAELSRCMYSLHGFEPLMRPAFGAVCHLLAVASNCTPGSALSCRFGDLVKQVQGRCQ